jgi:hypothetical protein
VEEMPDLGRGALNRGHGLCASGVRNQKAEKTSRARKSDRNGRRSSSGCEA